MEEAVNILHRSDSIQGTDYTANYFYYYLNLRVSRAKIENPTWRIGGDIISLIFRKLLYSSVALTGSCTLLFSYVEEPIPHYYFLHLTLPQVNFEHKPKVWHKIPALSMKANSAT